jgi:hypothetical protein
VSNETEPSEENRRTPAARIDPRHAQSAANSRQERPALAVKGAIMGNRGAWKIPLLAALPKRGERIKSNKNEHKILQIFAESPSPRRTGNSQSRQL